VELLPAVEERYGLGPVAVRGPLRGGYANDVLRLEAAGKPYVLRVKHPPIVAEGIAWEHDLVGRLAELIAIVPAPLPARDGSTFFLHDRFAVSLLPFVEGRTAEQDDDLAVARALGRLHGAAASLSRSQRPALAPLAQIEWPVARLPSRLAAWVSKLEAARDWAIRWTSELAAATAPIHGDFFPGNVLVADGRVTAVLDWEEARVDWPAIDLAAGVWHFPPRGGELDRDLARRFVATYRDAGGLPVDDTLLLPLIRVKRVLEVLRAPTDRHVDWEYQLDNLRAVDRLGDLTEPLQTVCRPRTAT
jgi:Ser/Thr protein kinase RdoA (MazF antagonist)